MFFVVLVAGETTFDPLPQARSKHSPQSNAVHNEIKAYTSAAPSLSFSAVDDRISVAPILLRERCWELILPTFVIDTDGLSGDLVVDVIRP